MRRRACRSRSRACLRTAGEDRAEGAAARRIAAQVEVRGTRNLQPPQRQFESDRHQGEQGNQAATPHLEYLRERRSCGVEDAFPDGKAEGRSVGSSFGSWTILVAYDQDSGLCVPASRRVCLCRLR